MSTKKRMLSEQIIRHDDFLELSFGAQCLYMHLCIDADDDGIVSPRSIIRLIGCTEEHLHELIDTRYILAVEGSKQVIIKHWLINNKISHYAPSTSDLRRLIRVKENRAYTLREGYITLDQYYKLPSSLRSEINKGNRQVPLPNALGKLGMEKDVPEFPEPDGDYYESLIKSIEGDVGGDVEDYGEI